MFYYWSENIILKSDMGNLFRLNTKLLIFNPNARISYPFESFRILKKKKTYFFDISKKAKGEFRSNLEFE